MNRILKEPQPQFEPLRLLGPDGKLADDVEPEIDSGLIERMHGAMLRARRFDERLLNLQRRGEVGTFAPVRGQEAAQIGSIACIEEDDWFVPAFRETAAALWRGLPMADLFVFTAGWNEGIDLPENSHDLPNAVPVASQLPHAVGIAYAAKLRGEESVVLTYFGDGATSEGDFHEALNFAGVFSTPVVFLCQNNGWAISVPRSQQTASETLAQKAHAYGIPAAQVDGNDVLAMRQATQEAVRLAREEGRPSMIEALTYRMEVHTTADDPSRYRDEEEVDEWEERDPIKRVQAYLKSRDQLDDGMIESLENEIEGEIDEAWEEAKKRMKKLDDSPPDTIFDHIFKAPTEELERQREAFRKLAEES